MWEVICPASRGRNSVVAGSLCRWHPQFGQTGMVLCTGRLASWVLPRVALQRNHGMGNRTSSIQAVSCPLAEASSLLYSQENARTPALIGNETRSQSN
jgi:hypothetical protein